MTSSAKYTPSEYLSYVKMDSNVRHLLVEGPDDQNAFTILFEYLLEENIRSSIVVNSADILTHSNPENRQAVEKICAMISQQQYSDRFVGFVDREFREFSWEPLLHDNINGHKMVNRLVWSRGHSVENYFLDTEILRTPLLLASPSGFTAVSIDYNSVFSSLICIACTIGLAANDIHRLKRVRSTILPSVVKVSSQNVEIDFPAWRTSLKNRMPTEEIISLFDRYNYWIDKVRSSDINTVRWLCDGHIAFRLVWVVYAKYLARENKQYVAEPAVRLRFTMCAGAWARIAASYQCSYPAEVIELLGVYQNTQD